MIFDSDILIWAFRKNEAAMQLVDKFQPFAISAVTYMELMQGALNKVELLRMQKFLKEAETTILPITESITHRAMHLVDEYALSDSMEMPDALIAATSIENNEMLYTANDKHYKCVPDLQYQVFRP